MLRQEPNLPLGRALPRRPHADPEDRAPVTPMLLGDAREFFFQDCALPSVSQAARLDQTGQEAVLSKLADSTRRSYGTGWKQWTTFMNGTLVSPFLSGETSAERQLDEMWLVSQFSCMRPWGEPPKESSSVHRGFGIPRSSRWSGATVGCFGRDAEVGRGPDLEGPRPSRDAELDPPIPAAFESHRG